jgi:hypothetical protein
MSGACSTHGIDKKCIQHLIRIRDGNRPLGISRRTWEDNIKMDLRETGWEVVDWIHVAQDGDQRRTVVNMVMNLRVP